jgi:hypothetical protein
MNDEMDGYVACMGHKRRHPFKGVVWRPEGDSPLGRGKWRWEVNVKTDLQELGWLGLDWIDLVEDRDRRQAFVNVVMLLWVP